MQNPMAIWERDHGKALYFRTSDDAFPTSCIESPHFSFCMGHHKLCSRRPGQHIQMISLCFHFFKKHKSVWTKVNILEMWSWSLQISNGGNDFQTSRQQPVHHTTTRALKRTNEQLFHTGDSGDLTLSPHLEAQSPSSRCSVCHDGGKQRIFGKFPLNLSMTKAAWPSGKSTDSVILVTLHMT